MEQWVSEEMFCISIREILGLSLRWDTGHPEWDFRVSSVLPGKCQGSTSGHYVLPNPFQPMCIILKFSAIQFIMWYHKITHQTKYNLKNGNPVVSKNVTEFLN
jgi:hypothetical protein